MISGNQDLPIIVSLAKELRLSLTYLLEKQEHILKLNTYIRKELEQISGLHINSSEKAIPHILNFSVLGMKPETLQHALEVHEIYVSTQTACAKGTNPSTAVMAVTRNKEYAKSSLRISISHLTTLEEITTFVNVLKEEIEKLTLK